MKKPQQPTAKGFGESVKAWGYEKFIATFSAIYPDADLDRLAKELGIEKPKRVKVEKETDS